MSRVFNMGVVVLMLSLLRIGSVAGADWELITQLPTERRDFATAVVDNKVYLIGGTLFKNQEGPYGISTAEVYDAQTNTWHRLTEMPTPRTFAQAAVVNGIIYVFGGYSAKDRRIANMKLPIAVEAYDPRTDTWMRKGDMPVTRINFRLGAVGEKVYLIGGDTGLGEGQKQRMDRVDIYDPATDTWARAPKMLTRRNPISVAVISNRLYVIGGYGWPKDGAGGPVLRAIEAYNPISRQWQEKLDMLEMIRSFRTVGVADEIYLIGGFAAPRFLSTVSAYHPQKEAWREMPELPTPLMPYGAATVNGKIYVFAGYSREGGYVADVLVFDTGFRAVEANGKLPTRWGELKADPKLPY